MTSCQSSIFPLFTKVGWAKYEVYGVQFKTHFKTKIIMAFQGNHKTT